MNITQKTRVQIRGPHNLFHKETAQVKNIIISGYTETRCQHMRLDGWLARPDVSFKINTGIVKPNQLVSMENSQSKLIRLSCRWQGIFSTLHLVTVEDLTLIINPQETTWWHYFC